MKHFTRIVCVILALACLSAFFAGCGKTDTDFDAKNESSTATNNVPSVPESVDKYIPDTLNDEDLNRFVFTILYANEDPRCISTAGDLTGDIIQDALYNSENIVSERFNMQFERMPGGDDVAHANTVRNLVTSGDEDAFSISVGHDYLTMQNALAGYYADLTGEAQFNLEKPWWPPMNVAAVTVSDKMFVASSYLTYTPLANASCVMFNKSILANKGIEAPYEKAFSGEWYMFDMLDLVEEGYSDLNGDGEIDTEAGEVYGFCMGSEGGYVFQRSVDIVPIAKDNDDLPYYALDSEKAYDFLEYLEAMIDCGKYDHTSTGWETKIFGENGALMIYDRLNVAYSSLRHYGDITYGFMPAPKLDEDQKQFISGGTDVLWGIPTTSINHMHEIATIVEALSCQNYNYVLPAYYESTMKTKLSDSEEDVKVLDIVRDSVSLSFAYFLVGYIGSLDTSMSDLPRSTTTGGLGSFIQTHSSQLEKKMESLVELYETLGN